MSQDEYSEIMDEALDTLDRNMAKQGVPLQQRPTQGALDFVRLCMLKVKEPGKEEAPPPQDVSSILLSPWFKKIHKDVSDWYRARYGSRMDATSRDHIAGMICIFDTPFRLQVPTSVHEPGKPGETIWVGFPEEVLPAEDSLAWLVDGPVFERVPRSDGHKARRHANEVAAALRFIRTNLMGVGISDPEVYELMSGIVAHLERAADQMMSGETGALKRAHWDLQMACESALKALSQQQSGTFKESHDLFHLFDQLADPPGSLPRRLLSKLPNWQVMAELRYGRGPSVTLDQTYQRYRATLKIVSGAVAGFKRMRLGQARFEIGKVPWLEYDPSEPSQ